MSQPHSYTARNYGVLDWIQHSLPLVSKSLPKDGEKKKKPTKAFLYLCTTSSKQTGLVWSALFIYDAKHLMKLARNSQSDSATLNPLKLLHKQELFRMPPLEELRNGSRGDLQIDGDVVCRVGNWKVWMFSQILLWNIIVSPYSPDLKYFEQKLRMHQSNLFFPDIYFGALIPDTDWYWILMSSWVELKWCSF